MQIPPSNPYGLKKFYGILAGIALGTLVVTIVLYEVLDSLVGAIRWLF